MLNGSLRIDIKTFIEIEDSFYKMIEYETVINSVLTKY